MENAKLVSDPITLIEHLKEQGFYGTLEISFVRGQILYAHKTEAIKFAKPEIQPTRETRERNLTCPSKSYGK
jgi:hypothetical protein